MDNTPKEYDECRCFSNQSEKYNSLESSQKNTYLEKKFEFKTEKNYIIINGNAEIKAPQEFSDEMYFLINFMNFFFVKSFISNDIENIKCIKLLNIKCCLGLKILKSINLY